MKSKHVPESLGRAFCSACKQQGSLRMVGSLRASDFMLGMAESKVQNTCKCLKCLEKPLTKHQGSSALFPWVPLLREPKWSPGVQLPCSSGFSTRSSLLLAMWSHRSSSYLPPPSRDVRGKETEKRVCVCNNCLRNGAYSWLGRSDLQ